MTADSAVKIQLGELRHECDARQVFGVVSQMASPFARCTPLALQAYDITVADGLFFNDFDNLPLDAYKSTGPAA
jgi:hypothetical protein